MKDLETRADYAQILQMPEWQSKRETILRRDGYCCVNCNSEKRLQVHHRQYLFNPRNGAFLKPWKYDDHNLITLCEFCHQRGHQLYEIPTFNL